jgi:hypothetical protein
MKTKFLRLAILALMLTALGGLAVLALSVPWASHTSSASASASLACSVKPSCGAGEVAVFRMSSTSNAHAGTPGGSSYGNVVCCGGVAGLGTSCSGAYETVLTLSGADNAHAGSRGAYPTELCLSAAVGETVDCWLGASCGAGYSCLASVSGTTNAHVADCNGVDDYATKVCCYAGPPVPVGGVAELPEVSGSSGPNYIALAGLAAAALVALSAGAWYARRRWFRQRP